MGKVLRPYGTSFAAVQTFAALWPSTNKQSAVQKSVAVFRGVCVKVSLRTACCCQKQESLIIFVFYYFLDFLLPTVSEAIQMIRGTFFDIPRV